MTVANSSRSNDAGAIRQRVWKLIDPVCTHNGYALVDVRFVMEPGGWTLRVFIDLADATGTDGTDDVDLDDCERISRELSAVLDVEDPIVQAYSLEVSSPGIDRPLVTEPHFRRFIGAEIKVTLFHGVPTPQGSDRKNFRGLLTAVEGEGDGARVQVMVDGTPWLLPIRDVDVAKIVPDWDAVMRGDRGQVRQAEPAATDDKKSKKGHRPARDPGRDPSPDNE
jgi:ribosome maturation factor RimP